MGTALILSFLISTLMLLVCYIPQGIFGMCIAYRKRGPLHTNECGFATMD
jgi:hypothetical protein